MGAARPTGEFWWTAGPWLPGGEEEKGPVTGRREDSEILVQKPASSGSEGPGEPGQAAAPAAGPRADAAGPAAAAAGSASVVCAACFWVEAEWGS